MVPALSIGTSDEAKIGSCIQLNFDDRSSQGFHWVASQVAVQYWHGYTRSSLTQHIYTHQSDLRLWGWQTYIIKRLDDVARLSYSSWAVASEQREQLQTHRLWRLIIAQNKHQHRRSHFHLFGSWHVHYSVLHCWVFFLWQFLTTKWKEIILPQGHTALKLQTYHFSSTIKPAFSNHKLRDDLLLAFVWPKYKKNAD